MNPLSRSHGTPCRHPEPGLRDPDRRARQYANQPPPGAPESGTPRVQQLSLHAQQCHSRPLT